MATATAIRSHAEHTQDFRVLLNFNHCDKVSLPITCRTSCSRYLWWAGGLKCGLTCQLAGAAWRRWSSRELANRSRPLASRISLTSVAPSPSYLLAARSRVSSLLVHACAWIQSTSTNFSCHRTRIRWLLFVAKFQISQSPRDTFQIQKASRIALRSYGVLCADVITMMYILESHIGRVISNWLL